MPAGLRARSASNIVVFDTSSYTHRLFGSVVNPSSAGSLTESRFTEGAPWVVAFNMSNVVGCLRRNQINATVGIGVTGTTLSWPMGFTGRIIYGVR